jgi:hypothetical protein
VEKLKGFLEATNQSEKMAEKMTHGHKICIQNGGKMTCGHKIYKMALKYQITIKYTKLFHFKAFYNLPKKSCPNISSSNPVSDLI